MNASRQLEVGRDTRDAWERSLRRSRAVPSPAARALFLKGDEHVGEALRRLRADVAAPALQQRVATEHYDEYQDASQGLEVPRVEGE